MSAPQPSFVRRRIADLGSPEISQRAQERNDEKEAKTMSRATPSSARRPSAKRLRGKLHAFENMPLDVLLEIAFRLQPLDLLQLTRTCRAVRKLFLTRGFASHAWAEARANVPDLPDCPPDLTEAQYASLMFETVCYACGYSPAWQVSYRGRVRFCSLCAKKNFQKGVIISKERAGLCTGLNNIIYSLLPAISGYSCKTEDNHSRHCYYQLELLSTIDAYHTLWSARESDPSALSEYISQRRALVDMMYKTAEEMKKWESRQSYARIEERDRLRSQRHNEIKKRLLELGHSEDDFPIYDDNWDSICRQPRLLTARSWNNIRPQLETMIQKRCSEKAEKEKALVISIQETLEAILRESFEVNFEKRKAEAICLFESFIAEHLSNEHHTFAPSYLDMGYFESITSLSKEAYATIPFTEERFDSIKDTLKYELDCFRFVIKQSLTSMLLNHSSTFAETPDLGLDPAPSHICGQENYTETYCDSVLDRASALFRCRRCPRGLLFRYDELLQHHHRFEYQWSVFLQICVSTEPFAFAKLILQECGLPEDISAKMIDTYLPNSFGFHCDQSCSLTMDENTHFCSLVCHLMHCGLTCHRFTLFNDPILQLLLGL